MTIAKKPVPRRLVDGRNRGQSSREVLLSVTVEQLNIAGETDIRLETILAEADCSPSSLYHHFGNLRGLLDEAQIVRFSHLLLARTKSFNDGVVALTTRDELVAFCTQTLNSMMTGDGPISRSQRVNALGSTYNRPDFAKRMAEVLAESCQQLASALRVPQLRGFIDDSLDLYAVSHWIQSLLFSRVLIELGGDEALGQDWNEFTIRAILVTLLGPGAV